MLLPGFALIPNFMEVDVFCFDEFERIKCLWIFRFISKDKFWGLSGIIMGVRWYDSIINT